MKNLAKSAVLRSGVLRLAASLKGRRAAILMYHSVREDPGKISDLLGGIVHSEAVFRWQMELLAREFCPMTLNVLADQLREGRELPSRSVIVTFDDGYADNHETAMPILNQTGISAVFYVTVDCIEKRRLPWPARLRFPFRTTKKKSWRDPSGKEWLLANEFARESAFTGACAVCCKLTGGAQDTFVAGVEQELEISATEAGTLMMTEDQLQDLIRHGHLVGSHTMSHPNMAYIGREEATAELHESKRRIEQRLGASIAHFSYPCPALVPHWNDFTASESGKAGYETAVTTDWGLVRVGDDPFRLKRVLPTKTVDGLRWNLECAFAGRTV